ncbi:AraC-type DNA-binding protein [Duganella sacchari]|uniref:AraC-type DNA-binding protein n=1 Tax=Duganella sacchari TaxID=551987 RepID=A0A1M7KMP0_9BURK|nr:helix-turn-helix domain-containing protein [Duganella sacchari]SHM66738.1 AraC-type DNA-binding protein [Duganella sacchari]
MRPTEFEPPEALRDVVKCFWHLHRDLGPQRSSFEVMPDGYAEIIFHFGGDCSADGKQTLPSPFLVGLLNQPVHFSAHGRLDILAIRCFPWTVFELLGVPPAKDSIQLFEHPVAHLHATLAQWMLADRIDLAVAALEQHLLGAQAQLDTTLHKAGEAIRQANGALPVSQVAAAAHATVRTLERKFKQSAGHTVKDVSGLVRFEQARNQLMQQPDSDIADLAQRLGYTDQSHLSREFKRYSGTTPAAFARKAGKP